MILMMAKMMPERARQTMEIVGVMRDMSPRSATCVSLWGRKRKAAASDVVKTTAVVVSNGSEVIFSKSQITKMPRIKKISAPIEMSNPYRRPSATPGSVRCPSAPPIKDIRLVIINDPM